MNVKAVIVNTDSLTEYLEKPERFCSDGRLEALISISDTAKRLQSLAAEFALSYALYGEKLGIPSYSYDETRRPVMEDRFISISHSGRFAAAAVSEAPVGIDVEQIRPVSSSLKGRLLSPRELNEYEKTPDSRYLLDRFVVKEAFLKMTGEGIWGGLDTVYETEGMVFRRGVLKGFSYCFRSCDHTLAVVSEVKADAELINLCEL